ncbi:hypothetical protein IM751_00565 [Moraxella sp. K1630]|nr:hypothetical protein [Moraxella sp. K1664]MBE9587080.1 hypothetical protein [Moraxella sp. K1630]MBE9595318.1 hypothetical protein [Moraxella sp. K2450]MDI4481769.1 hypothetical protein [Moraxella lacunata]MDI4506281.1 hypothetical protein [Moraxella lacunata]
MLTTIYPQDFETLDNALSAFYQKVYCDKARRWYKKRLGCYEKPSVLKRKRQKMKRLLSQRQTRHSRACDESLPNLWLKIELDKSLARTAPNAVGR